MQAQIGVFAPTFAPVDVENGEVIIKEIFNAAVLVIGVGSAIFWNTIAGTVLKFWSDSGNRGFSKDSFNAIIAYTINANKDALSAASQELDEQNSLSSALGIYFSAWQFAQADVVEEIFSGNAQTLPELGSLVQNGQMGWPTGSGPDFSDFVNQAQTLIYAQIIPQAWQHSATSSTPFVLESTDPCTSEAGSQIKNYMSDSTAAATHMCMNNKIYYLVNVVTEPALPPNCENAGTCPHYNIFEPLPGGTFDTLSGGAWAGVHIDDIVIASYQGWVSNGNKNGWIVPDFASLIQDGASPFNLFENGIQTAGYNSIPFCSSDNIESITSRILSKNEVPGPYWPCE
jgi:hypothetical protein